MTSVGIHSTIVIVIHDQDTTAAIGIETEIDVTTHTIVIHGVTGAGVACPAYQDEILVAATAGR